MQRNSPFSLRTSELEKISVVLFRLVGLTDNTVLYIAVND